MHCFVCHLTFFFLVRVLSRLHLEIEVLSRQLPCLRTQQLSLNRAQVYAQLASLVVPIELKRLSPELMLEIQAEDPENQAWETSLAGKDAQDFLLSPVTAGPSTQWLLKFPGRFSVLLLLILELLVVRGCVSLALALGLGAVVCFSRVRGGSSAPSWWGQ